MSLFQDIVPMVSVTTTKLPPQVATKETTPRQPTLSAPPKDAIGEANWSCERYFTRGTWSGPQKSAPKVRNEVEFTGQHKQPTLPAWVISNTEAGFRAWMLAYGYHNQRTLPTLYGAYAESFHDYIDLQWKRLQAVRARTMTKAVLAPEVQLFQERYGSWPANRRETIK